MAVFSEKDLDKSLIVYESLTGSELWRINFQFFTNNFQFSEEGDLIYTLAPTVKTLFAYNSQTGEIVEENTYGDESKQTYWNIFLTPDPNKFLFTSPKGNIVIYDKQKKSIVHEKVFNDNSKYYSSIYSNYYIKADDYEMEGVWNFSVSLCDINTLEYITTLTREVGVIDAGGIKISYNGKYAATNFGGRALQIWDLENKKLFKEYTPTIPTDSTDGRGGQFSLAFAHTNDLLINCGGQMPFDPFSYTTTITNFINDKRALISIKDAYRRIDISKNDTFFAGSLGSNFFVFKLHKNLVPVEEITGNTIPLLYPNPTTGDISIDLIGHQFVESVRINDLQGNEVTKISKNDIIQTNSKVSINLPKLNNGIYLLNVITNNGIISCKLIMEN